MAVEMMDCDPCAHYRMSRTPTGLMDISQFARMLSYIGIFYFGNSSFLFSNNFEAYMDMCFLVFDCGKAVEWSRGLIKTFVHARNREVGRLEILYIGDMPYDPWCQKMIFCDFFMPDGRVFNRYSKFFVCCPSFITNNSSSDIAVGKYIDNQVRGAN